MGFFARWFSFLMFGLGLALVVFFALGVVQMYAWSVPVYHLDGAYQTFSALSRLSLGEAFGRDFFPYLGVGVSLLLYPFFWLFGGDVVASTASVYFCVVLLRWACFSLCFFLFFPKLGWGRSALAGGFLVVAFVFIRFFPDCTRFLWYDFSLYLLDLFTVGNSLRAFRAFASIFVGILVLFSLVRLKGIPQAVFFFMLLSVCLFWSNDYGIPVWGMVLLTWLGLLWYRRPVSLGWGLALLPLSLLCFFLLLTLVTFGNPFLLLHYNFMDVAGDQYWYFGPWGLLSRIFSSSDLFPVLKTELGMLGIAGLIFPGLWFLRQKDSISWVMFFVSASLFGGGFVASYGGHLDGYFAQYLLWCKTLLGFFVLVIMWECFRYSLARWFGLYSFSRRFSVFTFVFFYLCFVFLGVSFWGFTATVRDYSFSEAAMSDGDSYVYDSSLRGYLPSKFTEVLCRAREIPVKDMILEEYWGLWGIARGKHAPLPVDSVIHALGSVRSQFLDLLQSGPAWVVTSSISVSGEWFPWSISFNWWFWREVLRSYSLEGEYGYTLLWEHRSVPVVWEIVPSGFSSRALSSEGVKSGELLYWFDAPASGYYEISIPVSIKLDNFRNLLMFDSWISWAAESSGRISVDPRKNSFIFPVWVSGSGRYDFSFLVLGKNSEKGRLWAHGGLEVRRVVVPAGFWSQGDTSGYLERVEAAIVGPVGK